MKKKVFLYAYDKVNLGDDLFIRTIVNRYPAATFFLWSNKENKKIFEDCKNLVVIDRDSKFNQFLNKVRASLSVRYQERLKKKCDAVVYIGGSIFMEYPSWKNIIEWWNYQSSHYPFYVVGANFGPYQSKEYKDAMGEMFINLEDVCFRDKYSYNLFQKIDTVRYAPDILFSYPMPIVEKKKKQIYISVINCIDKEDGKYKCYALEYENMISTIINHFLNNGYYIKLVSFCKEEGDEEAVRRIKNMFCNHDRYKYIQELNYNGQNYKELLYELASSEYVVATRFHAIILSLLAKQKVFPILYSNKSKNMLKDIGFLGNSIQLANLDGFEINKVFANMQEESQVDIKKLIGDSSQHFCILDQILN